MIKDLYYKMSNLIPIGKFRPETRGDRQGAESEESHLPTNVGLWSFWPGRISVGTAERTRHLKHLAQTRSVIILQMGRHS